MLEACVWVCEWSRESNGPPRCTCRVTFPAGFAQCFPFRGEGKAIANMELPSAHEFATSCMKKLLPAFHLSPLFSTSMKSLILSAVLTSFGLTCPAHLTASHAVAPARVLPRSYKAQLCLSGFVTQWKCYLMVSAVMWSEAITSLTPQKVEFLRHKKFIVYKFSYLHLHAG